MALRAAEGLASSMQAVPDVREILARAESTYSELSSLRARFTQTIEVPLLERTRTGSGSWYQKGRGRFKMEFEDPVGDVIVADGTYIWLYYPTTNPGQVIRSTIEARTTGAHMVDLQGRIFEDAKTIYDAEYLLEEVVTDRPTHLIELTPREASPYRRVRVWVKESSGVCGVEHPLADCARVALVVMNAMRVEGDRRIAQQRGRCRRGTVGPGAVGGCLWCLLRRTRWLSRVGRLGTIDQGLFLPHAKAGRRIHVMGDGQEGEQIRIPEPAQQMHLPPPPAVCTFRSALT